MASRARLEANVWLRAHTADVRGRVLSIGSMDDRAMPEIADATYDCIFCSGVLEHVDDFDAAMRELTRILRPRGILLLGLPFRQAIHLAPTDYWRFTEYGVRVLLARHGYEIVTTAAIDLGEEGFPSAYWTRAIRR